MERVLTLRFLIILALLTSSVLIYLWPGKAGVWSASLSGQGGCGSGLLCVHFLDVGQGDATLIESPAGVEVLIDGGPDAGVLRGLSGTLGFFDRDLDLVIATHPDEDHIGGLVDVLTRYEVSAIVRTENRNDTTVSDFFDEYAEKEGAEIIIALAGQVFDLGSGEAGRATLTVLFPDRDVRDLESNTASIIVRLSYGETDFMFTADAPATVEEFLVESYGSALQSEVLKVGHHGSRTSTDEDFLMAVKPHYAIISAGKDNRYGHPHVEVTDLLFNQRIETRNTSEDGSITIKSDGATLSVE